MGQRGLDVRDDAPLGEEEPAVGLEHRQRVRLQPVGGVAPRHLGGVEHLVPQPVLLARAERAGEDHLLRRAGVDRAGHVQQLLSGRRLQLAPQLVGAAQQRHVVDVLVVGEPDDPRDAVRRALLVRNVEPLEAEHSPAAARQVVERGAAHAADADDDRVVALAAHADTLERCSRLRPVASLSTSIVRGSMTTP